MSPENGKMQEVLCFLQNLQMDILFMLNYMGNKYFSQK